MKILEERTDRIRQEVGTLSNHLTRFSSRTENRLDAQALRLRRLEDDAETTCTLGKIAEGIIVATGTLLTAPKVFAGAILTAAAGSVGYITYKTAKAVKKNCSIM